MAPESRGWKAGELQGQMRDRDYNSQTYLHDRDEHLTLQLCH